MGTRFSAAGSEFVTVHEGFGFRRRVVVAGGHDVAVLLVGPRVLRDLGAFPRS